MIAPYDHEAMWSKARVFINRAMDDSPERSPDEQALWAAAALELLGKAALARVSPLLIATPSEDGVNVLIAAGLIEGEAKFNSVSASTIFKRCQRAFRPFNARDAQRFADARNEYLHGAAVGFTLHPEAWWPRYWSLATTLLAAQDKAIEDFVGNVRTLRVENYLSQNSKNIENRTEALIHRAQQRLMQYKSGTLPAKVQALWAADADLSAGLKFSTSQECPACGAIGLLEGDTCSEVHYEHEYDYDEDGPSYLLSTWANVKVLADYFSCDKCHLVLEYELLSEAGVAEEFDAVDDNPPMEPEYGND